MEVTWNALWPVFDNKLSALRYAVGAHTKNFFNNFMFLFFGCYFHEVKETKNFSHSPFFTCQCRLSFNTTISCLPCILYDFMCTCICLFICLFYSIIVWHFQPHHGIIYKLYTINLQSALVFFCSFLTCHCC